MISTIIVVLIMGICKMQQTFVIVEILMVVAKIN